MEIAGACAEITRGLLAMGEPSREDARREAARICAKYSLPRIPANHEILSAAAGQGYHRLKSILLKKPAKTASGVAVIALMPKPYACPHGRCTYCPGGPEYNSPNSYTGREPPALSAAGSGFDPVPQITSKLQRLVAFGHDTSKTELVIVGGTFLFMPAEYQERFIRSCYEALNGRASGSLEGAQAANESAASRSVGLTIETKPDYCRPEHVDMMLRYGATRVEIGVQSLRERVYRATNRGHTYQDVLDAFQAARDAGYKICAHMMPGLPTMTPAEDVEDLARLFEDPALRPDMLKIYPALVVRGTPLYEQYAAGGYRPYTDEEAVSVISEAKARVPPWARIMRIQREITPGEIAAGPSHGNLRMLVHERMRRNGTRCRCIRCREPGPGGRAGVELRRTDYEASGGKEVFLSFEDGEGRIHAFLRMRRPGPRAHRPEMAGACVIRELRAYGRPVPVGERGGAEVQHAGLGRRLVREAESVASGMGARRMLVLSAVGTRIYYRKLGYSLYGPYMAREI
ncbi:MAG: tRNA uridine(34) 5-carboxymethylaminomethyl modification radical SAM/GNAT enzyme Elp3 [Nitrosopumilus sp.]|nr:tRNA uridine(34) 5-carboxymethylaminomethyl modification radical SAM/GNAT enzyme Elp3 [Nitrosopumilus sp.]